MRRSDFLIEYRVRNRPQYDKAQICRGSLTLWVDEQAAVRLATARQSAGSRSSPDVDRTGSTPELGSGRLRRMLTPAKMVDYEACREAFRLDVPASFNFGFDVVAERARVADKTAVVAVDRVARHVERLSFSDLDRRSSQVANALIALGARKGDHALLIVPRAPVFFDVVIGCIKFGVVAMPGTNLLTAKDVASRVDHAGARIAIGGKWGHVPFHHPYLQTRRGNGTCPHFPPQDPAPALRR